MTATRPLDGVNVLDFCWVAVGPMTTKYLGEHGATVVRVESAKRPGTLRSAAPFPDGVAGINRSAYFASYNANKMGITVDMRHPRARDLMLRLAGWAHIVTENFTPGTMEGWGLGFEELKSVNPGLVMFSASMMGRGGPMERQPGFGPVLSSLVGLTNVTGWPDRTPVNPYGAYTDFIVPRLSPWLPSSLPSTTAGVPGRDDTWTCLSWRPRCTSWPRSCLTTPPTGGNSRGRATATPARHRTAPIPVRATTVGLPLPVRPKTSGGLF